MADSTDGRETGINLRGSWDYLKGNRLYTGKEYEGRCSRCEMKTNNKLQNHKFCSWCGNKLQIYLPPDSQTG